MARITAIIPMRRGQILGFEPRDGWFGWDSIRAYMPEDELHDLIIEIRSATQGLGELVFAFDHMAEVTGKSAAKAIDQRQGVRRKVSVLSLLRLHSCVRSSMNRGRMHQWSAG